MADSILAGADSLVVTRVQVKALLALFVKWLEIILVAVLQPRDKLNALDAE